MNFLEAMRTASWVVHVVWGVSGLMLATLSGLYFMEFGYQQGLTHYDEFPEDVPARWKKP